MENGTVMTQQEVTQNNKDYLARHYSGVEETMPDFLWYPYIPFGMITLVQGMPGSGKSTFLADIIACGTNEKLLPDGTRLESRVNAVYQCAEAGGPAIVKKMLSNAGADLDAVSFVQGDSLTLCDGRIWRLVEETHAKILVIDPMQEFLEANMLQAQSMRKELSEIARMAETTGCAAILVGHFTKSENKEDIYKGMGSADISAVARSILHIRRLERSSPIRYLSQIKCNIAPEAGEYAFEITNLGEVRWIGPVDKSDMDEINEEEKLKRGEKRGAAERDLQALLSRGDMEANEVLSKMYLKGYSDGTIRNVKKKAGVKSIKRRDGRWVWHLEP